MSAPEKSQRVADTAQKRQRLKAPKVQRAVCERYVLKVRLQKRGARELAVLERAAGEAGVVEIAVGEVASFEHRVGEQRTGEVAAGEEAVREPAWAACNSEKFSVGDDEAARVDSLEGLFRAAAQVVGLQGAQLFRNGRQRQGGAGRPPPRRRSGRDRE